LAGHLRSDPVHPEFSFQEIANILGVPNGEYVRKQVLKSISDPNPEGRPPLINKEAHAYMEKIIFYRSKTRNPVFLYELADSLRDLFEIVISVDTLAKYLRRDKSFTKAVGVPMEEKRLHINHNDLLQWYDDLNIAIRNIQRYFIFNMDETGLDDWVDSRDYLVAIPRPDHSEETKVPVE
jgi:hypothetical protein